MANFWVNILFVASILIVAVSAGDVEEVCPFGSTGTRPNCVCNNKAKYNEVHNVCPNQEAIPLESLAGTCPDDSTGVYPNCACKLGKVYDHNDSICLDIDRTKCPKKSVGSVPHCKCEEGYQLDDVHWYCRAWYINDPHHGHGHGKGLQCPVFHTWDGKNCEPIRCPNDASKLFPHCVDTHIDHDPYPVSCPPGQNVTIEKPYCHCPHNQVYTYPICHDPCPEHTFFDLKTKSCGKRPCPAGWSGDYYPHCISRNFQTCPPEFPGKWPNCNIYDEGPRLEELKQRRYKNNLV